MSNLEEVIKEIVYRTNDVTMCSTLTEIQEKQVAAIRELVRKESNRYYEDGYNDGQFSIRQS